MLCMYVCMYVCTYVHHSHKYYYYIIAINIIICLKVIIKQFIVNESALMIAAIMNEYVGRFIQARSYNLLLVICITSNK